MRVETKNTMHAIQNEMREIIKKELNEKIKIKIREKRDGNRK